MVLEGALAPNKAVSLNLEGDRDEVGLHQGRLVFRKTQDATALKSALDEFHELLPVLTKSLAARQLELEFLYHWGRFQFCSGILLANVLSGGDDLGASRGGKKSGLGPRERAVFLRGRIAHYLSVMANKSLSSRSAAPSIVHLLGKENIATSVETVRKHIDAIREKMGN